MSKKILNKFLDPIEVSRIIANIVTEDAPTPHEWKHRRYLIDLTQENKKKKQNGAVTLSGCSGSSI